MRPREGAGESRKSCIVFLFFFLLFGQIASRNKNKRKRKTEPHQTSPDTNPKIVASDARDLSSAPSAAVVERLSAWPAKWLIKMYVWPPRSEMKAPDCGRRWIRVVRRAA